MVKYSTKRSTVAIENSLRFYQALVANKVPAACVVFETDGHGPNAFTRIPLGKGFSTGGLKSADASSEKGLPPLIPETRTRSASVPENGTPSLPLGA